MDAVREYHERTKHHLDRYAAALGFMDWANQPDPFRSFDGTEPVDLPHPQLRNAPTYDSLFAGAPAAATLDAELIGRLCYLSLALSAWKTAGQSSSWSLRVNPSSGALHPTEGYFISGSVPGLIDRPGVFHYAPYWHRLERRCQLSPDQWDALTEGFPARCLFVGLTSIYWRESWKYGERAFRYCHHDAGHAIGAVAVAARTLGWQTRLLRTIADDDLSHLLGVHLQSGFEAEHPDCLLALFPADADRAVASLPTLSSDQWHGRVPRVEFTGVPNRLSDDHQPWPAIDDASRATRYHGIAETVDRSDWPAPDPTPTSRLPDRQLAAEQIIRQRRSAVELDGKTPLRREVFYEMLRRLLPSQFPFDAAPGPPRVSLAIFVHRVDDLESGLYLLVRDEAHEPALRAALKSNFEWQTSAGIERDLRLYHLHSDDTRPAAKQVSCHQDIAADGAFSLGMLAEFDAALATDGAGVYPRLFWETGIIGQVLYLEAEAAGIRATGIGCFFDDVMHDILGITDHSWQSLYHFTVGGPLEDERLQTIAAYDHLDE